MGRGQWPTTSSVKTSVVCDASGFFQNAAKASTLQRRPGCICVIAGSPSLSRSVFWGAPGEQSITCQVMMRIACRVVADHDEDEAAMRAWAMQRTDLAPF